MLPLLNSLRQTADILDGWLVGRLVIDQLACVELDNGNLIPVATGNILEVRNGEKWQRLGLDDFTRTTVEGWPAYAGLDARMKA